MTQGIKDKVVVITGPAAGWEKPNIPLQGERLPQAALEMTGQ